VIFRKTSQALLVGIFATIALALTSCVQTDALALPDSNSTKQITVFKQLAAPVVFEGKTDLGSIFNSSDNRGHILVVNFWYAACGPCRSETPELSSIARAYAKDGVQFIGVNTHDTAREIRNFAKANSVPYLSLVDNDGAVVRRAFKSFVPPSAIPTTLVLNDQGRVVSRVVGELPSKSALEKLVESAIRQA
jgi:thiol-disulfide isomerase/thioredoxin